MNYKVDNAMDTLCGTCLRGYIYTTYDQLVEMFGNPRTDVDKSTAHWSIQFTDGAVATIYDWKNHVTPENLYRWHVGGRSNDVVGGISDILKLETVV